MTMTVEAGYVITASGVVLVQLPAANRWGFILCDDDQAWLGGIGIARKWTLVPDDHPRITPAVRERLGWMLDEYRAAVA